MLIRVRFRDGRIDLVPSKKLDELIVMSDIEQFERSNGLGYARQRPCSQHYPWALFRPGKAP